MRLKGNVTRQLIMLLVSGALVATSVPLALAAPELRRVIVELKGNAAPEAVAREYTGRFGGRETSIYRHAITGFAAELPAPAVAALARDPRVVTVEPDEVVTIFDHGPQHLPTGIDRSDTELNPLPGIDGVDDRLDTLDVAILDTGVDFDHPDLNVRYGTDCRNGLFTSYCSGSGDFNDYHGHGTHVAGIVGSLDNGFGSVGVAPGVTIWAVKVLNDDGSGYLSWIIAGIDAVTQYADQIDVANLSLGCECPSSMLDNAISNSVAAGVVYAVAAGNSAKDASTFSPASHPDVISVSALADFDGLPGGLGAPTCRTDQDDTLADFSNYGATVDLAAPGTCIYSTHKDGLYATLSGTSMASPYVAGLALLRIANSGRDANADGIINQTDVFDVRSALIGSAHSQASACGYANEHSAAGSTEPLMFANAISVGGDGTCQTSGSTNSPPLASAGSDQTVTDTDDNGTESVTLDGSLSSDSDGTISSYDWHEGTAHLGSGATLTVSLGVGSHDITLTVTDDDGATATDNVQVTVEAAPVTTTTIHVGDLDSESYKGQRGTWAAGVAITVHDDADAGVGGVVITGSFYQNGTFVGTESCTTLAPTGTCFVASDIFPNKDGQARFVVESVSLDGSPYDPSANHDPDGDSDGTTIIISKGN